MRHQKFESVKLGLLIIAFGSMLGCVPRERVTTYDVTQTGKNYVSTESVQEYRKPNGKRVIEKQYFYEKVKCVGKKGNKINANTPEECLKRGGRIIDETIVEEQTIGNQ